MSLFNRKVLQIGVANLTLLQKYCILNIGNTLVGKKWTICCQYLRRLWLQTASSWLQFCTYYSMRKSAYLMHMHICILCMCANFAYCNMWGIDDCKRRELDNCQWQQKLKKWQFEFKVVQIQILNFKVKWNSNSYQDLDSNVNIKDTKPDWHLLIFKRGVERQTGVVWLMWSSDTREWERELQNDARVVFAWGWLALEVNQDLIGEYFGRLSLSLSKLRSWDRTWNVNFLNGSVIISSWRARTESSHLISFSSTRLATCIFCRYL